MSTKIQINSLAALERLIGGEEETEIEIRRSIIKEFANKHLKELAETTEMKAAIKDITKAAEQHIGTWVKTGNWSWDATFVFDTKIERQLSDMIENTLITKFEGLLNEKINAFQYLSRIEKIVEDRANYIANKWTDGEIERRIQAAADKKIKEKLGI